MFVLFCDKNREAIMTCPYNRIQLQYVRTFTTLQEKVAYLKMKKNPSYLHIFEA